MVRKIKNKKRAKKFSPSSAVKGKHNFIAPDKPPGMVSYLPELVDYGLTIFYIGFLLSLWFAPDWSGIEVIYNMVLILLFEFILVHMGTMMAVLQRGFFFIFVAIILGGVAYIFHTTQINSSAILYIYAVTLINRIIIGRQQRSEFDYFDAFSEGIGKLRHYVACFIIAMFLTHYLSQGGLTQQYLTENDYYSMLKMTGMTEKPLMIIQFGVLYYSTSLLWVLWRFLKPSNK